MWQVIQNARDRPIYVRSASHGGSVGTRAERVRQGATDWSNSHLGAVPSSYVRCLRDNILPLAWQGIFAERFKVDRTATVDAGHQVMINRPHALVEALLREAGAEVRSGFVRREH